MRRLFLGLLFMAVGCNLVTGVDDFQFGGAANTGAAGAGAGGAGSPGGSAAGGAGGSPATGGAGGEPSCDVATQKECDEACVALTDPTHGCDNASCAACDEGSSCCPDCTNTSSDPTRCGSCNGECDSDEWCVASQCECRPGLEKVGASCVDPLSNPAACGGGSPCSGPTPFCQAGACVAACTGVFTACGSSCVDKSSDPLHCGGCQPCELDKVCVDGECMEYKPAPNCDACPCSACSGGFSMCCNFPGSTTPVCVTKDAGSCP
ncbi:MAG: hypothetical protein JNK04_18975 [Myxococcales bacterium]|nr:hypothetical protein [Myxococcales bacterium]